MTEGIGDEAVYLRLKQLKEGSLQFTDSSNAFRLFREHGNEVRYVAAWKKWLVWVGNHWQIDEGFLIHERGLQTIRGIYDEVLKTDDYRERIEIEKFAMQSESARRRNAMIEMAAAIPQLNIKPGQIDTNPWLFNARNGTLDLESGLFRTHRQDDMISKIAEVEFDEKAGCPVWKQFIREIMDYDTELMNFLQIAAGLALTGDISEQTMFILHGAGANGKSTFLNTVMRIMGDYAISTNTETFMKRQSDQISNDIARLRGTRLVVTTETEQGKSLSEPLIKKITGNDNLTARFLYGEYFDFRPTFKIYMATNHKPMITGTDYGIWRRIKLIPFTTTITPEKQDKHLEEKLYAEASGILNWMIEGARMWFEKGLAAPDAVSSATEEYRGEMDVLGAFLKECCVQNPAASVRARELFKAYQEWCEDNNEHACSERFLSLRLKELKIEKKRCTDARYWMGIGLKASGE